MHRSNINIAKLAIILTSTTAPTANTPSSTHSPSCSLVVNHFVYKNLNSEKPVCYEDDTESLIHEENLKFIDYRTQLAEVRRNFAEFSGQEGKYSANSLMNLSRQAVNKHVGYAGSVMSGECALFRLPARYKGLVNFLSYGLIEDLYGSDEDLAVFDGC